MLINQTFLTSRPLVVMVIMLSIIWTLVAAAAAPSSSSSSLQCGNAGFAAYLDSNRVDLMATQWMHPPTQDFTIEYWIRIIDPYRGIQNSLSYGAWDTTIVPPYPAPYELLTSHLAGGTYFYRDATGSICDHPACNILGVPDNPWHHFAYVATLSSSNLLIYVDGNLVWNDTQINTDFSRALRAGGLFSIGQAQYSIGGSFNPSESANAMFDEYRIWSVARTSEEIAANYRSGVDETNTNLVMYHRWDQGASDLAINPDLSPEPLQQLLMGAMPGLQPFLSWTDLTRTSQVPTHPFLVTSGAPLIGAGPIVILVNDSYHDSHITLIAHDHSSTNDSSIILQYTILSLPNATRCGHIIDMTNITSGNNGTILSINDTAYGIDISSSHSLLFRASLSFITMSSLSSLNASELIDECIMRYRVTQLSSPFEWCDGQVSFIPNILREPTNRTLLTNEGKPIVISLGGVSLAGESLATIIQSLPTRGTLYHAMFMGDDHGDPILRYDQLIYDTSLLTPIQAGQMLNTSGGYPIVIYASEPIGYSSPAADHPLLDPPYTTFTYSWSDIIRTTATTTINDVSHQRRISSAAIITIQVIHVDDAPISTAPTPIRLFNDTNCASPTYDSCGIVIPFTSTDIDVTFANQTYYRITSFPLLGDLYQLSTIDSSMINALAITSVTTNDFALIPTSSETTFSWAKSLMRVSSQFSNCGYQCFHPETCPSSCTDTEYRATNVLGPYDWYPEYASSPLSWGGLQAGAHEWIELDYGKPMYVTGIEIYEVWITGPVVKIAVASTYDDDNTDWIILWQSTIGPSLPGPRARVFSPPLCAGLQPVRYLRLDLDNKYGWPGIDAVKLIGTEALPTGQLLTSGVIYVPPVGIMASVLQGNITVTSLTPSLSSSLSMANVTIPAITSITNAYIVDTFSFTASDCITENSEPTMISVLPSFHDLSTSVWKTYTMPVIPRVFTTYTLPMNDIYTFIKKIAAKSMGSFVSVIALQTLNDTTPAENDLYTIDNTSTSIMHEVTWLPYTPCNSSMASSPSLTNGGVPSFAVLLPLTMPAPSIIIGVHIRVQESSLVYAIPRSYTWMIRIQVDASLQCDGGMAYHNLLKVCVDCLILPARVLDMWPVAARLLFYHDCPLYGSLTCSSSVPIGVPCVSPANLSLPVTYVLTIVSIIILMGIAITAIFLLRHRRTRTMYASAPVFLTLGIFIGAPMVIIAVILILRETTVTSCTAIHWLLHIGVTLLLSTMILKNYRLHFIFNRKIFGGWQKPPSDYRLLAYLGLCLMPDITVLIIWTILSPTDSNSALAGVCDSTYGSMFQSVVYSTKVPQLVMLSWLAYKLRKLHELFNESVQLRITVISFIIVTLPIILMVLVGADGNKDRIAVRIATSVGLLYVITIITIAMLYPRVRAVKLELLNSSKSKLMRQPSGLLPGLSRVDKEDSHSRNNSGISGNDHGNDRPLFGMGRASMNGIMGGTNTPGNNGNGTGHGHGHGGFRHSASGLTTPTLLPGHGMGHTRTSSGTIIPVHTLMMPSSPSGITRHTNGNSNGNGAMNINPIHNTLMTPSHANSTNNGIANGSPSIIPSSPIGGTAAAAATVIGGVSTAAISPISTTPLSLEAVVQARLQRRSAAVQHLDFKMRELKKNMDATQTELDRAHEELHAAYLESEYQQIKKATSSAKIGVLPPPPHHAHAHGNGNGAPDPKSLANLTAMISNDGTYGNHGSNGNGNGNGNGVGSQRRLHANGISSARSERTARHIRASSHSGMGAHIHATPTTTIGNNGNIPSITVTSPKGTPVPLSSMTPNISSVNSNSNGNIVSTNGNDSVSGNGNGNNGMKNDGNFIPSDTLLPSLTTNDSNLGANAIPLSSPTDKPSTISNSATASATITTNHINMSVKDDMLSPSLLRVDSNGVDTLPTLRLDVPSSSSVVSSTALVSPHSTNNTIVNTATGRSSPIANNGNGNGNISPKGILRGARASSVTLPHHRPNASISISSRERGSI